MSSIVDLRAALRDQTTAKDVSRAAGQGVWANYVRATMYVGNTPTSVEDLTAKHKELVAELCHLGDLSKDEKNSLRSAKSVVAKAITNNIDVWQRDDAGLIVHEDGVPMPKGKSELQEAKTDFQKLLDMARTAAKKLDSEHLEPFTEGELKELADAFGGVAYTLIQMHKGE